jgi:hypothetical protein
MHLLDLFSFSLEFPAIEGIFYSPVHSISCDLSQEVSSDSDLKLVSSPIYHVSAQDKLSSFFKGLNDLLDLHGLLCLFEYLLVVSIVFYS